MGAFLSLTITGLSIATIGGLVFAAIMIGRRMSQRDMDRQRRAYVVTFPAEVDAQQVSRWLRTISGRPHGLLDRFVGVPAMVFEVWADSKGITHRLKLPWSQVEHLIPQLQSKVPGAHVMLEEDPPRHTWKSMQELGERAPSRTLDIPFPDVLAESLLTSMQPLKDAEVMLLQWVLVSVKRERSTSESDAVLSDRFSLKQLIGVNFASRAEIEDRNRKLSEPNFRGVLRMAATAETQPRADHLVTRMRSVLDSTATGSNRFVKLHVGNPARQRERIRHASGSVALVPPVTVSASELTGLIGWPIGNPNVAGLPQGRTPHLPPTEAISRVGRVLARSTYPGSERPLAMTPVDACKHVHVVGPIGSGKTVLLGNMAVQDMQQGHGVILIESKGDLFHYVLDRVPAARKKDVIVLDANDADHPVGFNLLQQGTTRAAVDELSALMTGMYQDTGVYTPLLMYHGLHALAAVPGAAVSDLPALLTPQGPEESAWRDELIGNLKNNEIRRWWQEFLNKSRTDQDRMALPLHNRLWQLTTRPEVRNIIGQSRSTFSFEDALANNKIVLVYLSPARIGETSVNILGALLIDALWRARRTTDSERPTFLYMDEFQEFVKLFNKTSEMTAQARSFKLGLVLAHQHLGQLPRELRDTLMTNARTKVAFQTEGDDVRTLAQMFARNVDESYLRNLPNYHVLMKFATDHGVTGPVTGATLPPMQTTGSYEGVRRLSRAQYSRPIADVEAEMEARRRPSEERKPKKKPRKFGGTDW